MITLPLVSLNLLSVGVKTPLAVNNWDVSENSTQYFATPLRILCKLFGRCNGRNHVLDADLVCSDWVGGMFMLLHRGVLQQLDGSTKSTFCTAKI